MTTAKMTSSPVRTSWSRQLNASILLGGALVALVVAMAVLSFIWTPHNPYDQVLSEAHRGPSVNHLMGTDRLGRDVFSTILYGSRIALLVGLTSVGIALLIGTPVGILAGMRGGWIEEVIMRLSDMLLAFPALLLAMMFAAVFGPGTVSAMVAIGIASIPGFARVARAGTLQVMSREYVAAAKAASQPRLRIALRHVLPNVAGMIVVQCSVTFSLAVLAEAALSYLGLGTQPPTASWGRMLQEAQQYLWLNPMLVVWPGLAIALAVMGFNMLGDGLRDRFDPKLKGKS